MYKIKESPEDFIVEEIIDFVTTNKGKYSYFELKKRNYNTEEALMRVTKLLDVPRRFLSHCGNKDKIAITTQYISVENLKYEKRKDFKEKDLELKYLGQNDERLNLGSHDKNKFTIIVRDANPPKEVTKIKNLFGPQRFSTNNKDIGKAIIKKDFKTAVELIKEGNGNYEDDVREFLHKNPNNYIGALRKIPKKTLQLLIHSYQSYLFNKMAENSTKEVIPIIGFATKETEEIKKILKEENITTRDFIIRQLPDFSTEGEERDLYIKIENLKVEKQEDNTYKVSFTLGKGSYATVVIDSLFI